MARDIWKQVENIQSRGMDRAERGFELDEALELMAKPRIDERDFIEKNNPTQAEKVERHIRQVKKLEAAFDRKLDEVSPKERELIKENERMGKSLENIVTKYGEDCMWFGSEASITRTSKFDDFMNGVDAVIEFAVGEGKEAKHLGLAIDVVAANDPERIKRKVERNEEKVAGEEDENNPGHKYYGTMVRYYESPITGEKMKLHGVVPVVLGLERDNFNLLLGDAARLANLESNAHKQGAKASKELLYEKDEAIKKMMDAPAQVVFLKQIAVQLEGYADMLRNDPDENAQKLLKKINIFRNDIDKLIAEKKHIKSAGWEADRVYKLIKNHYQEKKDAKQLEEDLPPMPE